MEIEKLKCLLVRPNELPVEIEIEDKLEEYQKLVGGYIETTYIQNVDDVVLICNDEGKINGMNPNRDIGHDIIFGPFLIIGDDYENAGFKSLTENQILENKIRFDKQSILETNNKITALLLSKNVREER
jgi:hypothetical protein